ncbi:MAG TPA: hypothetical protein ENI88_06920 [Desulfobulbus sp.]|nr:hypothetical protein [Desulfobulbus sp.]
MLIPLEQPYLQGLNSYYLKIDKFVEHLQGEIGSGCLYFKSSSQEILIYFDEQEILRGVVQDNGAHAQVSPTLEPVFNALKYKNFRVTVYQLDPNAIFFWGQMPQFQRAKKELQSSDIQLPDLIFRLKQKNFSGFVHVRFAEKEDGALLFFHKGQRVGGSYTWGQGGLDSTDKAYNNLLKELQKNRAAFAIGHFIPEKQGESDSKQGETSNQSSNGPVFFSNLDMALEEFLGHYSQLLRKKTKSDSTILLKQQFVEKMDEYPFLDPFKAMFDYADGRVSFSSDAPREKIAAAIVDCAWNVVVENRLEKKFRAVLKKWDYKSALEERGIVVER